MNKKDSDSMNLTIGKVKSFDGFSGEIITQNAKYIFLDTDIIEGNTITNNDFVSFRGEEINGINRAYFVRFFAKDINEAKNSTETLEKLLKKAGDY